MFIEQCNDCLKTLTGEPLFHINQFTIRMRTDKVGEMKTGQAHNLHFCDEKCFRSWLVKNENRPSLLMPNGIAQ